MEAKHDIRAGVFRTPAKARRAIELLKDAGFDAERISVVCSEDVSSSFDEDEVDVQEPAGSHTPEAAAAGGAIGAVLGGATVGVGLATTGGAALLVAGPLLGAAAGAVGGSFVGAMSTRGFEPAIADYYDQALEDGLILVAVEDEDAERLARAEEALAEAGSEPVELDSESP